MRRKGRVPEPALDKVRAAQHRIRGLLAPQRMVQGQAARRTGRLYHLGLAAIHRIDKFLVPCFPLSVIVAGRVVSEADNTGGYAGDPP